MTIASKVASEFSEASGDLYIGSLIELALVLFGITLLVNIIARLLVWRITSSGDRRMKYVRSGYSRRKWISRLMLTCAAVPTAIAIIVLVLILGYTLVNGISYLNLDFITQAAKPVGEAGGGMRDEIFGTFILVGLASVIALPVGLMAGSISGRVCRSESGRGHTLCSGHTGRRALDYRRCFCLCHTGPSHAHVLGALRRCCAGYHHDSGGGAYGRGVAAPGAEFTARGGPGPRRSRRWRA